MSPVKCLNGSLSLAACAPTHTLNVKQQHTPLTTERHLPCTESYQAAQLGTTAPLLLFKEEPGEYSRRGTGALEPKRLGRHRPLQRRVTHDEHPNTSRELSRATRLRQKA